MFRWIKRIIVLILFAVALVLGITFTSQNSQPVSLMLYGYALPEWQLGLWILIAVFVGGLIGLLLSFLPLLLGKQSLSAKERKILQLQKEIEQLRTNGLKG